MAEITATTLQPLCWVSIKRRATARIRSGVPTEVPPYFWTIRRMARPGRDESEGSRNGMVFAYVPSLSTRESVRSQLRVELEAGSPQDLLLVRCHSCQLHCAVRHHLRIFQSVTGDRAND